MPAIGFLFVTGTYREEWWATDCPLLFYCALLPFGIEKREMEWDSVTKLKQFSLPNTQSVSVGNQFAKLAARPTIWQDYREVAKKNSMSLTLQTTGKSN